MVDIDIMDKIQTISEIGLNKKDKQKHINVIEVFYAWDILVNKYDILNIINYFENLINDKDLVLLVKHIKKTILIGITSMEETIAEYGIPFAIRPPEKSTNPIKIEYVTDRLIFNDLNKSIQSFFPTLGSGYVESTSSKIKKEFKNHLLLTMKLHEEIIEYGKLKGFLDSPPIYRP